MMKELFYQIEYSERESQPRDVVCFRVLEDLAPELCADLRRVFREMNERQSVNVSEHSRDDMVDELLGMISRKYNCTYTFVPMTGVVFVD